MKHIVKLVGVILLVCGISLAVIGGMGKKSTEPSRLKVGYVSNGQFYETDSSYIGGNSKGAEMMNTFVSIGTMAAVGGLGCLVFSGSIRD